MNYEPALRKVRELQQQIRDVHPLFIKPYPIAIVEGDTFLIYDVDEGRPAITWSRRPLHPCRSRWAVRAAFDLECYENKIACVVTGEVFDKLEGYVTIFHEFVHCHQAATCEQKLKQSLE